MPTPATRDTTPCMRRTPTPFTLLAASAAAAFAGPAHSDQSLTLVSARPLPVNALRFAPLAGPQFWLDEPSAAQPIAFIGVFDAAGPIGVALPARDGGSPSFVTPLGPQFDRLQDAIAGGATPGAGPFAWAIAPTLAAELLPQWPNGAECALRVDMVGPGVERVWIRCPPGVAMLPGEVLLRRVGSQPAARLDVLAADGEFGFARVTPLVRGLALDVGAAVVRWPSPADRRDRVARSAVSLVDARAGAVEAWFPTPPCARLADDAHVAFFRGDQYLGHGFIQRGDAHFSIASYLPLADLSLGVGDVVRVRTRDEAELGSVAARVFEVRPEGVLIDAGDADGLRVGQSLVGLQEGSARVSVTVRHVEHSYALAAASEAAPAALRPGDELRDRPPARRRRTLGVVTAVVRDSTGGADFPAWAPTIFTARVGGDAPLGSALAVCNRGGVVAAAVLVGHVRGVAMGVVAPMSQVEPIAAGDELMLDEEPPTE